MTQRLPGHMGSEAGLAPGALVTPTIRLERPLGHGGMGSVWLAEHLTLRAHVVVKFMAQEYASSQEARQRFEREASLSAQAKSPHVVQVFDHGTSLLGLPYIAMELLEGEDLGKRIERDGSLEPRLVADWLTQACRGLARAHAKGITHRDIKPENIFLCENDGQILVKVLDFGIAKSEAGATTVSNTQTGAMVGTACYMSPEQIMGQRDVDYRSDLWALGVVAYLALTGSRPFEGNTLGALAIAISSGSFLPPSLRRPELGPAVDAWMARALACSREERFQSAKALAETFEQALSQPTSGAALPPTLQTAAATLVSNAPSPLVPAPSTLSPSTKSAGHGSRAPAVSGAKRRGAVWLAFAAVAVPLAISAALLQRGSPVAPFAAAHSSLPSVVTVPKSAPAPATPKPAATTAPDTNSASATLSANLVSATPSASIEVPRPAAPKLKPSAARPLAESRARLSAPAAATSATMATSNPAANKSPLKMEIQ
jgi:eukaryotic-like serine/threonine-protein kinase